MKRDVRAYTIRYCYKIFARRFLQHTLFPHVTKCIHFFKCINMCADSKENSQFSAPFNHSHTCSVFHSATLTYAMTRSSINSQNAKDSPSLLSRSNFQSALSITVKYQIQPQTRTITVQLHDMIVQDSCVVMRFNRSCADNIKNKRSPVKIYFSFIFMFRSK